LLFPKYVIKKGEGEIPGEIREENPTMISLVMVGSSRLNKRPWTPYPLSSNLRLTMLSSVT